MRARILSVVLGLSVVFGCSAKESDDDGFGVAVAPGTSGRPAQLTCDEIVECLEDAKATGRQTCALAMQDELDHARGVADDCEYQDDPELRDDCEAIACDQ